MQVNVRFSYYENVIPPKCRKPRRVRFDDGETHIEIKEVSASDAPVAIRAQGEFIHNPGKYYALEYRWWNQQLWTAINIEGVEPRGRTAGQDDWAYPAWPSELDLRSVSGRIDSYEFALRAEGHEGRQHVAEYLVTAARQHILVGGIPYRPAGEPRHVVMTFGIGRNHGSTACMMDGWYNPNVRRDRYFSLLERDKAIALATDIATTRGDTQSLPIKPHGPEWTILIPEAIQVNSVGEQKQPLSEEDYVAKCGGICPVCGSDQVEGGSIAIDGPCASQGVVCNDCNAEWTDVYQLSGYSDLTSD